MFLPAIDYWGHADPLGDKLHEECAIFGIFGNPDAAVMTTLGLHALQHRGQEAAGIVTTDNGEFYIHKRPGLVGDVFGDSKNTRHLVGRAAVGHTRYSTVNGGGTRNVQPLVVELATGGVAMAHNGHLTNGNNLRHDLIARGQIFQSDLDSESILHLIARSSGPTIQERLAESLQSAKGGYALALLTSNSLIGARDPFGIRPIVLGRIRSGGWVLSSETCPFDLIGADFVRELKAGEVICIDAEGVHSLHPFAHTQHRLCAFELVYFTRPDSFIMQRSVYQMRVNMGIQTASELPDGHMALNADVVVPVPDSGSASAIGFARQSQLPLEMGIIRNHYVGRTFIEPTQTVRNFGVRMKHSPNTSALKDRNVVLIDDSLVRGTTSKKIVSLVRGAGAKKVHLVVTSPTVRYPCIYGIDVPKRDELLAATHSIPEINEFIGADSLSFLSIDGLYRAIGQPQGRDPKNPLLSDHVFTGDYVQGKPNEYSPDQRQLMFADMESTLHRKGSTDIPAHRSESLENLTTA